METVCIRAYMRSLCQKQVWHLYQRFVYFLFLINESIIQGSVYSGYDKSSDKDLGLSVWNEKTESFYGNLLL
jgi:hypothetical protein